jgi:TetR/AcrR family transcriptional repressor of nem operon
MMSPTDTRQRLIDTARGLFHARSYADVGVQAICKAAGVQKGSFYHFFPSKRDLTLAVLDEFFSEFKQHLLAEAFAPDLPPLQRFGRLVELAYRFQADVARETGHVPGCPFGNLAVELSTREEPIRRRVEQVFGGLEERFQGALQEALQRGEVGDIDVPATARAMLAYMEGVMLMAKTRNDPEVIRRLGPAVVELRIAAAQ